VARTALESGQPGSQTRALSSPMKPPCGCSHVEGVGFVQRSRLLWAGSVRDEGCEEGGEYVKENKWRDVIATLLPLV